MRKVSYLPLAAAVLAASVAVSLSSSAGAAPTGDSPDAPLVRNVILMIDDGAGYNHHEAGSLFDTGKRAHESYNHFPYEFAMSTYSYGDVKVGQCGSLVGYDPAAAWSSFDYVRRDPTDSAAAATAMATGLKTYDAAIGVDCAGQDAGNISEGFEELGKSTGVVTSVPFTHATPASFIAHNVARDDFSGISKEMVYDSATDVIMGAGHPFFLANGDPLPPGQAPNFRWMSRQVLDDLRDGTAGADADGDGTLDPWTFVEDREQFLDLMEGETPRRLFGLVQVFRTLQVDRSGDQQAAPFEVQPLTTVPTLREMMLGALNVLDQDGDGFFLMVEGGATDFASHSRLPGRMVEEEVAFNRSVDAAVRWVEENSNWGETMLIATSDHETGYLTGPGSGSTADGPVWNPLVDNGRGVLPGLQFNQSAHTNSLVPIYVKGDAGRFLRGHVTGTDPLRGLYVDNTDVYRLMLRASGAQSE